MMTKLCGQCGEIKPIEQFRQYYGGRKGHYKQCLTCERINSREKYLRNKEAITENESAELQKIHQLWDYQRKLGLRPPGASVTTPIDIDAALEKFSNKATTVPDGVEAPPELIRWLTEPLNKAPEYYQEQVWDYLQAKYHPQLYIDKASLLPVYDERYATALQQIAARFDDYEDTYYE